MPFSIFESEIFFNELEEKLVKDNAKKTIVAIDLSFGSSECRPMCLACLEVPREEH